VGSTTSSESVSEDTLEQFHAQFDAFQAQLHAFEAQLCSDEAKHDAIRCIEAQLLGRSEADAKPVPLDPNEVPDEWAEDIWAHIPDPSVQQGADVDALPNVWDHDWGSLVV